MTSKTRVPHGWGLPVAAMCAAVLLAGCGSSGGGTAGAKTTASVGAGGAGTDAGATTTTQADASDPGAGTPSRKPCDLLTKSIAETALGGAVRDAKQSSGPGNETCGYRVADTTSISQVYLTTYAARGTEALLDAAAAQFANAYAVDGVGDAARVSLDAHAIGVLKGDTLIAIGLIPPMTGQDLAPVTEKQLADIANAVVSGM